MSSTGHLKVTNSNLPGKIGHLEDWSICQGRLVTCGESICNFYGIRLGESIPEGTSGCQIEGLRSSEPRCIPSWGLVLANAGIVANHMVHGGCIREKNTVFNLF